MDEAELRAGGRLAQASLAADLCRKCDRLGGDKTCMAKAIPARD